MVMTNRMTHSKAKVLLFAYMLLFSTYALSIENEKSADKTLENADHIDNETVKNSDITVIDSYLPQTIPGGTVELNLRKLMTESEQAAMPQVYFGRHQTIVLDNDDYWKVIIGVNLQSIPGRYVASVVEADKSNGKLDFTVIPHHYSLASDIGKTVKNRLIGRLLSRKPQTTTQFKILKDLPWSNLSPQLPLNYPAKGSWSDQFGHVYQNSDQQMVQTESIQLTTTQPQLITSPADAICLQIDEEDGRFSVWLDHGMGLFSHISGLPDIAIEEQDKIIQGSMISNITDNASNRRPTKVVWRVVMNNALINPHIMTHMNVEKTL